jgi:exodeoxyribonuclease VII small subunit
MSNINPKTYEEALQELQSIVKELENREIKIDDLATKVSHAKALVDFCREKLSHTEEDINKIIRPDTETEEAFEL